MRPSGPEESSAAKGNAAREAGTRPVYSIGAVAKMVGVEATTLRSWEERYKAVIPARSGGSQRVYSRDQVEQLRFIADRVEEGVSAAERTASWRNVSVSHPASVPEATTRS